MTGPNHESKPVQIMNDNDIAVELRRSSNSPTEAVLVSASLLEEAADEIERLRTIITDLDAYSDHDLFCEGWVTSERIDCPCGFTAIHKAIFP